MRKYELAVEWNRVRESLTVPGSRVERSFGPPNFDEPLRVRTVDPVTNEDGLREVETPLPRDAWAVVDPSGAVIATAAAGAPEAWRTVVAQGATARRDAPDRTATRR